jgi:FAS-associated factor 2
MAALAIDVGQLSEEQQLALEQYTSVTDQDIQAAIPLLQRSQWNVQVS